MTEVKLLSGNEAIVEGAIAAGLGFFSAYPITPASEIMQKIANSPIKFLQAEDEIAGINACVGASLAGAKVMTATSGPGFSLKQETIGLAFKFGIPLVIVNSQRVGPSTGMPTLGAQGDIIPVKHGTHGEYVSLVFYPNSIEECYKYTIEAFNASEEAQCPVILLCDGHISHMYETADLSKIKFKIKNRKIGKLGSGKINVTSLTSTENGIPDTKNYKVYRQWYKKRKKQILDVAKKYNFYEYLENKKSKTLLVAYGISSRVVMDLKDKYSIFRPIRMFPIVEDLKRISKKYKKIIVVEMNDGKYRGELEGFLKREIGLISQLGGKISTKEIKDELKKIC